MISEDFSSISADSAVSGEIEEISSLIFSISSDFVRK